MPSGLLAQTRNGQGREGVNRGIEHGETDGVPIFHHQNVKMRRFEIFRKVQHAPH